MIQLDRDGLNLEIRFENILFLRHIFDNVDGDAIYLFLGTFHVDDGLIGKSNSIISKDLLALAEQNLLGGLNSSEFFNPLIEFFKFLFRWHTDLKRF